MEESSSSGPEELRVVSEVNPFFVLAGEIKPLHNAKNKITRLQFSLPKSEELAASPAPATKKATLDEDGDLIVQRKNDPADVEESLMFIEYENSTKLEAVGLQIWRGAFLLADHILAYSAKYYKDRVVLELGAGTGLTSIVAAIYAKKVIATDIDSFDILDLIRANVKHNEKYIKCDFELEPLDFTAQTWSPKLEEFVAEADVILAADVVYHERITKAFVGTLKRILSAGKKSKDIFIAMEKRYVFTLEDLDTVAPMYAHFVDELESTLNLSASSKSSPTTVVMPGSSSIKLTIQQMSLDFPQYFNYERTRELVLWHLSSTVTP